MRMGAIFARGSCRALKWMAMFGVVFALGAGSAAAQEVTKVELNSYTLDEAGSATVTATVSVPTTTEEAGSAEVMLTLVYEGNGIADETEAADETNDNRGPADISILTVNPLSVAFTAADAGKTVTGKFELSFARDLDAEDEKFYVTAAASGQNPAISTPRAATIMDAHEQKYVLSLPDAAKNMITEGADTAAMLTLKADPTRTVDIPVALAVNPNDPTKYTLGGIMTVENPQTTEVFGMGAVTATIAAAADGDRLDDEITVTAYSGALGSQKELTSLTITVADVHNLPVVEATIVDKDGEAIDPAPMSAMEGEDVYISLSRAKADAKEAPFISGEEIKVTLMPASGSAASAADYRLSQATTTVPAGESGMVKLELESDEDVGDEMLVFDAMVAGLDENGEETSMSMGIFMLTIVDGTDKLVEAKSMEDVYAALMAAKMEVMGDHGLNPGEDFMLMGSDLFDSMEGVSVSFVAASDSDAVDVSSDGSTITVMPMMATMEGMPAKITVTATAAMPSGVEILTQTRPNVAQVLFPVDVVLEPITYMISGPEDMNLAEGGMSAMVTVTANRGVDADTEVMLMRDGASMAGMDDFMVMPEMAMIMAGDMMAEFEVMAVEDDMMEEMEGLTLFAVVDGMQTDLTVSFYLMDMMPVPALPLIAQLLLAAFLGLGGYRRYLRR